MIAAADMGEPSDDELLPTSVYADEPAAHGRVLVRGETPATSTRVQPNGQHRNGGDHNESTLGERIAEFLAGEQAADEREAREAARGDSAPGNDAPHAIAASWGVPADLWGAIAPIPPLPRGLLPATLEAFAFGKPDTFSPAALAAAALATCAIAATDHMRAVINPTWRERFCVWVGLYGPSSAAKSPTMSTALRPLVTEQQRRLEEWRGQKEAWDRAKKQAPEGFDDPEPLAVR